MLCKIASSINYANTFAHFSMGGVRFDANEFEEKELIQDFSLKVDESEEPIRFDENKTTWMFGASATVLKDYGPIRNANVFASHSTSFVPNNTSREFVFVEDQGMQLGPRGGGFIEDPTDPTFPFRLTRKLDTPEPLSAETGEGTDIGIKFDLFEGRINGTITYFDISRSGIVRSQFALKPIDADLFDPETFDPDNPPLLEGAGGVGVPTLSGKESTDGFEFELNMQPLPNWDIFLGAVVMDSEVESNPTEPGRIGKRVVGASDESVNFWTRYTFDSGLLQGLTLGGGVEFWSKRLIDDADVRRHQFSGPETLTSLFAAYEIYSTDEMKARLRINVDNLTDERFINARFNHGRTRIVRGGVDLTF